jgi:hypothetical protein
MSEEEKLELGVGPAKIVASGSNLTKLGDVVGDLLSPFSQGLGLIGDHIRIYRQRTTQAVLEQAQAIALDRGQKIKPINSKNLIQIIENSSSEDETDDEIIDVWSRLLLSGDEEFDAELAQLADSLKRIGKKEAEFLKSTCCGSGSFPLELTSGMLPTHNESMVRTICKNVNYDQGEKYIRRRVQEFNKSPGLHYGFIYEVWTYKKGVKSGIGFYNPIAEIAKILDRERLMRTVYIEHTSDQFETMASFCDVTSWGVNLMKRCYPELAAEAEARRRQDAE